MLQARARGETSANAVGHLYEAEHGESVCEEASLHVHHLQKISSYKAQDEQREQHEHEHVLPFYAMVRSLAAGPCSSLLELLEFGLVAGRPSGGRRRDS